MFGLVPNIHDLCVAQKKDVDGRDKPDHDDENHLPFPRGLKAL
jgi:hypothetical protein